MPSIPASRPWRACIAVSLAACAVSSAWSAAFVPAYGSEGQAAEAAPGGPAHATSGTTASAAARGGFRFDVVIDERSPVLAVPGQGRARLCKPYGFARPFLRGSLRSRRLRRGGIERGEDRPQRLAGPVRVLGVGRERHCGAGAAAASEPAIRRSSPAQA